MSNVTDFSQWLENEMKARGWRQAELIRRSGVSSGLISQILSGQRRPGVETCRAIARAFGLPDIQVMQLAGLASYQREQAHSPAVEIIATMLDCLLDADLEEIRAIVQVKYDRLFKR